MKRCRVFDRADLQRLAKQARSCCVSANRIREQMFGMTLEDACVGDVTLTVHARPPVEMESTTRLDQCTVVLAAARLAIGAARLPLPTLLHTNARTQIAGRSRHIDVISQ